LRGVEEAMQAEGLAAQAALLESALLVLEEAWAESAQEYAARLIPPPANVRRLRHVADEGPVSG
jgi:hypothetical protein